MCGRPHQFPCKTETYLRSTARENFLYDLHSLYFYYINQGLSIVEYIKATKEADVKQITSADRKLILQYLNSEVEKIALIDAELKQKLISTVVER